MYTTIKGVYEAGKLMLSEEPPVNGKSDVMVTFLVNEEKPMHKPKRILDGLEGKINTPDDFNEPLEDLKDYM